MIVFLDQDGVLAEFDGGVQEWYGIVFSEKEKTQWAYDYKLHGMSASDFWSGLSYEFWRDLKWTIDGCIIYEIVKKYNPVILTSPPWSSSGAVDGKAAWIRNHIPEIWRDKRFAFASKKHFFAHPNALLIDDKEENVTDFIKAGGKAILVPRPWNRLRRFNTVAWVIRELNKVLKGDN